MIQALSEAFVIGADAMAHEALWERIYRRSFWAEGGGPIVSSALSAIDTALWDIKGKALKQPVWRLLGGAERRPLRTYASQIQFDWSEGPRRNLNDPSAYREAGMKAVADGYDCVKVDPVMIGVDGAWDDHVRGPSRPNSFHSMCGAWKQYVKASGQMWTLLLNCILCQA
jgi:L-alanine-DL-glutamate epimerase-like enolase superfamily enzyme